MARRAGLGERQAAVVLQPGDRVGRAHVVAGAHVDVRDAEVATEDEADHRERVVHDQRRSKPGHLVDQGVGVVAGEAHVPARHGPGRGVGRLEGIAREEIDEAAADALDGLPEAHVRVHRHGDVSTRPGRPPRRGAGGDGSAPACRRRRRAERSLGAEPGWAGAVGLRAGGESTRDLRLGATVDPRIGRQQDRRALEGRDRDAVRGLSRLEGDVALEDRGEPDVVQRPEQRTGASGGSSRCCRSIAARARAGPRRDRGRRARGGAGRGTYDPARRPSPPRPGLIRVSTTSRRVADVSRRARAPRTGRSVQVIEEPQEIHDVERPVRGAGHAAHVLLDEPHAAHVVARGAGSAERHALGAGVEAQDVGPAEGRLDRVHALAAAEVEDPQRLEGPARQIARELHDPPDLHRVRHPGLRERRAPASSPFRAKRRSASASRAQGSRRSRGSSGSRSRASASSGDHA